MVGNLPPLPSLPRPVPNPPPRAGEGRVAKRGGGPIFLFGLVECCVPPRSPRALLLANDIELRGGALALSKIRASFGASFLSVQKVGLRARRGRPQPHRFERSSVDLRLSPDDDGMRDGMAGQGIDQFSLLGACLVQVTPRGARRLFRLLFRAANQLSLNDEGLQRPLCAPMAESRKALQGGVGGQRTISRICRRVSSIVAMVALA
jgi:hypothetical protein